MSDAIKGKVIIVTGAASGIGEAAATLFATAGARVIVADMNPQQGAVVAQKIQTEGFDARFIAVDVAREQQVEALINTVVADYGRLDGAFNNAGIGPVPTPIADTTEADWQRVLSVNLTGVFFCVKHEIRALQKTGGGLIVNMASVAGLRGVPMQVAYSASKHGIIGLTKTAAAEYGRAGIRVNAVCPGIVDTAANRALGIDWNALIPTPLGRVAQTTEIAELVLWLLSERSSYVTGQAYAIDGGMTAATFNAN